MRDQFKSFKRYATDLMASEQARRGITISGPTPLALVYPNNYATGMSSLGFQTVYRLFNERPMFHCERVFIYENPFAFYPYTLETQKGMRNYRIIAFSSSYELDYPNILLLLRAAGVPLLAQDRGKHDPLVVIGGVTAFYNPTVMAPSADVIFIGEGEVLIPIFADAYEAYLAQAGDKMFLLEKLAVTEGFYVPQLHGLAPSHLRITRQHLKIFDIEPATSFSVSKRTHMHMFLVEVGRGCGRGCRFCAAGHVYRPYRYWPVQSILDAVSLHAHTADRIGLVGAALSDFRDLDQLCSELLSRGHPIGLSSLRADRITPILLQSLADSDITSVTIAPEAGAENMRNILHKNLSEEQILSAVQRIADSHIKSLKLYFMIGLPFETDEDIDAIVKLMNLVAPLFLSKQGKRELRVSINAFVPKPWTPFQWAAMATEKEIKEKRKYLQQSLQRIEGVSISRKSAREELLQGILSVGDHRVGLELIERIRKEQDWSRLYEDWQDWLGRSKELDENLPWDFIDCGISKKALWKNWQVAGRLAK